MPKKRSHPCQDSCESSFKPSRSPEERLKQDKEWVVSPEGQKALSKAREEAEEAIKKLTTPQPRLMQLACTCCPVHGAKS